MVGNVVLPIVGVSVLVVDEADFVRPAIDDNVLQEGVVATKHRVAFGLRVRPKHFLHPDDLVEELRLGEDSLGLVPGVLGRVFGEPVGRHCVELSQHGPDARRLAGGPPAIYVV